MTYEIKPNLPEPPKLQDVSDEVESFAEQISGIYEEAVHWRPNSMKVPTNGILASVKNLYVNYPHG